MAEAAKAVLVGGRDGHDVPVYWSMLPRPFVSLEGEGPGYRDETGPPLVHRCSADGADIAGEVHLKGVLSPRGEPAGVP